ncbi:MAG: hypothetical protein ACRDLM_12250 [Gaiellaceae bacterium]
MSVANFIPSIWNASLVTRFAAHEVLAATMNRQYEGDARRGNKVKITGSSTPTIQNYATGTGGVARTMNTEKPNTVQIDLNIDQEKGFQFEVDDIDATQAAGSFGPIMSDSAAALVEDAEAFLAAQLLSEGMPIGDRTVATTADAAIGATKLVAGWNAFQRHDIGKAITGTNVPASSKITDVSNDGTTATINNALTVAAATGDVLTIGTDPTAVATGDDAYNMALSLATALTNNKVPLSNRFLAVNGAYSQFLLGANSKLSNVNTSGMSEGLRDAVIGRLLGFTVVTTPLLTADPSIPTAVGYHGSASAYVSQIDKNEAFRSHDSFADVFRALHVYGGKTVRPQAIQIYQP